MYGEQGEHKHVFEYKSLRAFEHLVITVPHKKTWGTESPSGSPGNTGCSHCSPVPPFFFYRHIWAMQQIRRGDLMSLLSSLLDHMPPPDASEPPGRPAPTLTLARNIECVPVTSPHMSASTATPEWRYARDQYLNHIMVCRACYAPTGRYCLAGADLRAGYENTTMESPQKPDG